MKEQALAQWYASATGEKIAQLENQYLQQSLSNLSGYHLVQLAVNHYDAAIIANHRYVHSFVISPINFVKQEISLLQADYEAIPLRDNSIDAIVALHVLEYCDDPIAVLMEIQRVLSPQGHVLLLGFQPWHPWCWQQAPKLGKRISSWQMQRNVLDAELVLVASHWLHYGAIYFIQAQKQVHCMTPLRLQWENQTVRGDIIQPTAQKVAERKILQA